MVLRCLLDRLASARAAGESFEQAWPDALRCALGVAERFERQEWADVLASHDIAESWRHAFERRPPRPAEQALRALEDPDRETVDVLERHCARCGSAIAAERDPRARWCSDRCRRAASYERERAQRAYAA